jgi:hypothetical protein
MSYVFSVPVYVYDVWRFAEVEHVKVKYVEDDVLIIRRGLGMPKQAVAGRADVVVGLDEHGRIVNVEIEFVNYYFIDKEDARKVLKRAVW